METPGKNRFRIGLWVLLAFVTGVLILTLHQPVWSPPVAAWMAACSRWLDDHAWWATWLSSAGAVGLLTVYGVFALVSLRDALATRRAVRRLRILSPPPDLADIAERHTVTGCLDFVEDVRVFSFVYGLVRPRIVVSAGMHRLLRSESMEAVLLHEVAHLRAHDPLRLLFTRAAARALWFLPVARELAAHSAIRAELVADAYAVGIAGPASVAEAMHRVITHQMRADKQTGLAVAPFDEAIRLRIARLVAPDASMPNMTLTAKSLVLSFGAAVPYVFVWLLTCRG